MSIWKEIARGMSLDWTEAEILGRMKQLLLA